LRSLFSDAIFSRIRDTAAARGASIELPPLSFSFFLPPSLSLSLSLSLSFILHLVPPFTRLSILSLSLSLSPPPPPSFPSLRCCFTRVRAISREIRTCTRARARAHGCNDYLQKAVGRGFKCVLTVHRQQSRQQASPTARREECITGEGCTTSDVAGRVTFEAEQPNSPANHGVRFVEFPEEAGTVVRVNG